jgi:hypothetical protein
MLGAAGVFDALPIMFFSAAFLRAAVTDSAVLANEDAALVTLGAAVFKGAAAAFSTTGASTLRAMGLSIEAATCGMTVADLV